jgi:hypothetical protein
MATHRAARLAACVFAVVMGTSTLSNAATLTVAWDPSPDAAVVGYVVSMGTRSGVYTSAIDAGTQTVEQFSNLTGGTTYYFVVQAYDRSGNKSAPSSEVAGVAPLSSRLAILCPVPTATSSNGSPVIVAFSPTVSGGVAPVSGSCSPASGSLFPVGATHAVCTARDAAGAVATCDTTVAVLGPGGPAPGAPDPGGPCLGGPCPDAPTGLVSTVTGSTVVLRWVAPASYPTASYVIEAGSGSGLADLASFDTGNVLTTYTASSVPQGVYFVRVRARTIYGLPSTATNEAIITVGAGSCPAPLPPSGLSAVVNGSTVALNWRASSTGGSYVIEAGSVPGASDLASFDTQSPATSYTAFGVGNGTYYVRLRGTNSCGARSTASNEIPVNVGR